MTEWSKVRSYRPGRWFAVLGEDVIVLLPPSERARAATLWQLIDDGAEFAEVLDAVLSAGLRELPACALLDIRGTTMTVVLRGPVRALVDGEDEIELTGESAATWVERSVRDVRRLVLEPANPADAGPEADDDVDFKVDAGLVRVTTLELGDPERTHAPAAAYGPIGVVPPPDQDDEEYADHEEPAEDAPGGYPAADEDAWDDVDTGRVETDEDDTGPVDTYEQDEDEQDGEDDLEPGPEPLREAPRWTPGTIPPPPPPVIPPAPPAPPAAPFGGHAAELPDPSSPVPGFDSGEGEHPEGSGDLDDQPTESIPATPGRGAGVARLTLSDGASVEVDRPVLFGRAPRPERCTTDESPLLHPVPSPQQEISATHVEVRTEGDDLVVTDLGSTNGTVVVLPGEVARDLRPHEPVRLTSGALIDLGDGLSITVE